MNDCLTDSMTGWKNLKYIYMTYVWYVNTKVRYEVDAVEKRWNKCSSGTKKEGDGADIVCFGKPTKRACLSSPNHVSWDWGRQNKQNVSLDSQETRMFWTYQNQVVLEKIRETHCIGVVWSGAVLELIMTCGERSKQNTNKPARTGRHLTGRQGYIIQLPETYLPVEILGILTSSDLDLMLHIQSHHESPAIFFGPIGSPRNLRQQKTAGWSACRDHWDWDMSCKALGPWRCHEPGPLRKPRWGTTV